MTDALDSDLLIPIKMPGSKHRGRPRKDGLPSGSAEAKAADAAKGKQPRTRRSSKISDATLKEKLTEFYVLVGMGVMAKPKYQRTAMSIVAQAEPCADAWMTLAKENKAIRTVLERMITVSTVGTLLMAHAPIILSLTVDSGLVKEDLAEVLSMGLKMSHGDASKAA